MSEISTWPAALAGDPAANPAHSSAPVLHLTIRRLRTDAVFYDGSPAAQQRLCRWVGEHQMFGRGIWFRDDGTAVVNEPWRHTSVEVAPGRYLVFVRDVGAHVWLVLTPGQLETCCEVRPRELAVFDDGEVV